MKTMKRVNSVEIYGGKLKYGTRELYFEVEFKSYLDKELQFVKVCYLEDSFASLKEWEYTVNKLNQNFALGIFTLDSDKFEISEANFTKGVN